MSDLDMLLAERTRKALQLRDGKVDFGDFMDELLDLRREMNGLEVSDRGLEILV